ncbi:hypothetical protein [Pararhodospirillum oryzae]|uniref:Uncharacterized protein n=1 Tax=Pararhodospirillum oryzae TaxID=478448 RepID=A0A512H9I1_9PROT|nr:hypothetical protein [Pararhodospirillum oryzae]GEO82114.1 hypothetical protein ROR02_22450 [Pararhodospirillum oryzae]
MTDAQAWRDCLLEALPVDVSVHHALEDWRDLYVPPAHVRALRLDASLVVGDRGVGKSCWAHALTTPQGQAILAQALPEMKQVTVHLGFSATQAIEDYPTPEVIGPLLKQGHTPYDLWRAVVLRWADRMGGGKLPRARWENTLAWMRDNPEGVAHAMAAAVRHLASEKTRGLIVFDALDRASADWQTMDALVQGLLRTVLWVRSFPGLHAKVFLRPDQAERTVGNFPDASKLMATRADLVWSRHDLHGLLWHHLVNAPGDAGKRARALVKTTVGSAVPKGPDAYRLPEAARLDTREQRALFDALAGPWMGRDQRRGIPYVWSVGHLADGKGRTSPRSFLAAIRQAAEDSKDRYPDHALALHYESIKRGIRKASGIRVAEIAEDYPWVRFYCRPLAGLTVPCAPDVVLSRWQERFPNGPAGEPDEGRLPPPHADEGWEGLREDLVHLGIFQERRDGRLDMPDLYRVGFGLGRRGGVKPIE